MTFTLDLSWPAWKRLTVLELVHEEARILADEGLDVWNPCPVGQLAMEAELRRARARVDEAASARRARERVGIPWLRSKHP